MAREQGFELCHFTRPAIAPEQGEALDAWIAAGMHGDMAYMGEAVRTARRKAPDSMLEGVRTVISLGMCHTPPSYTLAEAEQAMDRGVFAAYAHGDDYHEVMKKRLKALARELDALLGEHGQRVYVDTAPVLEHALASASGLGWQGRHSLTISRQYGSWLMLGEIFTTADLTPDAPAGFHCGSCRACLDICPTQAIVAPFTVDARRCISYLTIEYGGIIPRELRPLMGNRIFGCDDCQAICPWNRHATAPEPDLLKPRRENILPSLVSLLRLDEAGFRERFRKSPVKRTGRIGLLRNACIAAGNSGDVSLLPHLQRLLNDEAATLRAHAVWAMQQLCNTTNWADIVAILERQRQQDTNQEVIEEIELSLQEIRMNYG
jgi:epoxyqueuosine reductase